ncbi:MAG TPA: cyclopropane-fatty-acyl-phospholipid synthase family protein [Bryobacteraceae bacterium]|nr:cyclopropane-fatty-acyl-phospholipid synthase family protein [Bryobacteraceae bacterium]
MAATAHRLKAETGYIAGFREGRRISRFDEPADFTIFARSESHLRQILDGDWYTSALGFIRGEYRVTGDLTAAIRLKDARGIRGFLPHLRSLACRMSIARVESWFQTRARAAQNIRFHYDVSNEFYRTFLDSRLIYSEGWFDRPEWTLAPAPEATLEHICSDLGLEAGHRFLDIGCGWGALISHAAARYGAHATGCTLSHGQYEYATALVQARGLHGRVEVLERDYRDLPGRFDRISSIGMFEHVGRRRLGEYFRRIHRMLAPGGRFVNSGISRPQDVHDDPQTRFLLRRVFPGGELAHLSDVIREAELAGFSILDLRNLRRDYARTCREWVANLKLNHDHSVALVGEEIYRTWLLYLAASACSFEKGESEVFSIVMTRQ